MGDNKPFFPSNQRKELREEKERKKNPPPSDSHKGTTGASQGADRGMTYEPPLFSFIQVESVRSFVRSVSGIKGMEG